MILVEKLVPPIKTENLTKIYKLGGKEVRAVDGVNLEVPKRSIFGLLGRNGAGKSTLIHMLMGTILPTSGRGTVLGYDIVKESLKIREKVGFMPEGLGFYEDLTAEQNLMAIAKLMGLKKPTESVRECLKLVGLWEYRQRKYGEMSVGMKQRLGIAQALLKDPELLVLDEPTSGVDPDGAREFRRLIQELNKQGKTIFISTHLLYEIGPLFTHIAVMRQGKIVVQGSVSDLKEKLMAGQGYVYEVELSKPAQVIIDRMCSLNGVKEAILEGNKLVVLCSKPLAPTLLSLLEGYGVESFRLAKPTLEDIFREFSG
ncbi:MAG: ABC transporter ATP-binding protein [Thermoprotei archaeon]|nr:MAG: ABC transporter ATP-binding protein [Thermoprotei archaeon]